MEARHKSNIWDVATTAGVYITRARTGFSTHYAVSIIYTHTDVGLILPKLGICPWITELTALAQSAHHISFTMVVWVTKFHAIRCSKLGGLSQIVVDVVL